MVMEMDVREIRSQKGTGERGGKESSDADSSGFFFFSFMTSAKSCRRPWRHEATCSHQGHL